MDKKYYIGLDIGTNSCGWAVTDENYNLLRAKRKTLWGVRLFDEANTAESRRQKRANRRRLDRRKLKLLWLKEIFEKEINLVDPLFFQRLKYSSLWEDDKIKMNRELNSSDSLFNTTIDGKRFTDKEYYENYPTIFHLRNEITKTPAKDIRLLYLALHSIIKRRGHFLFEGDFDNSEGNLSENINEFIEIFKTYSSENGLICNFQNLNEDKTNKIVDILRSKSGIRQTKLDLNEILNAKSKQEKSAISCFVDGKINLKELFNVDIKLEFNDEKFLETYEQAKSELSDEEIQLIDNVQKVYSLLSLRKLLGKNNYICESMVELYETHKSDLIQLKNFIKLYHKSDYFKVFRDSQETKTNGLVTNYPVYVKGTIYSSKKRVVDLQVDDRSRESFYKFIKSILEKPIEANEYNEEVYQSELNDILQKIDNNIFLPKQRTKANSVLPNKLYQKELKRILEINSEKFPFLNESDEFGTNSNKILQILEFRVPYFVGPVGGNKDKMEQSHGWANTISNLDYKPWTLNKIVDFDVAENDFISKMTNKCSYLRTKSVLPKYSFLYSKFRVLNELNNLKFNGNEISVSLKQKIFNDLFCKNKKITIKMLKEYLVINNFYSKDDIKNLQISGIDKDFLNDMSSYSKFINSENFGEDFTIKNEKILEKIIFYSLIVSDRNRFEKRIIKEFGDIFSPEQIKELKGINYPGWGRLSREFLSEFYFINKITGERTTIIDELWKTNQNLQQIIFNSNYTIQEELEKLNTKQKGDISYEDVDALYCSPSIKRSIWQTIKIINEIKDTMGSMPSKIFVEVTRNDETKGDAGRKLSRKNNIQKIYSNKDFNKFCNEMGYELEELIEDLNKRDPQAFRSEKIYLYFMQLGRCLYSGEKIDILDLFDDNKYDVDHILPQSKIKDNSIDNKVLVKKQYNLEKSDYYPIFSIKPEWVISQKNFWLMLKKLNLMSDNKYDRLIRTSDFSDEELGGFIERQIVETNQSIKAVIDFLKTITNKPNDVVYSKSSFVSDFRNKYDIYKSRIVNDYHHAKDAYLNIVVGNVIYNRFTSDPRNFFKNNEKNQNRTKNVKNLFDHPVYSCLTGDVIWNGREDINKIIKICDRNDCLVTRYSYCNYNGEFYNETLYKKSKTDLQPLKGNLDNPLSNPLRYGGYNSINGAYFVVIESEKKNKYQKTIESVPILFVRKFKNNLEFNEKLAEFFENKYGLSNVKIIKKLNYKSTFIIGDGLYLLGGKTNNQIVLHNANQWYVDSKMTEYIKSIEKFIDLKNNNPKLEFKEVDGKLIISPKTKEKNKEIYLSKADNLALYNKIIEQLSKNIYAGMQFEILKDKLINLKTKFEELEIKEQAFALSGILKRLATGSSAADLSILGAEKNVAKLLIGKDITNRDIRLIESSSLGLKTKITRL